MAKKDLTSERLRELIHYDPESGKFSRREREFHAVHRGTTPYVRRYPAKPIKGWVRPNGYVEIGIENVIYFAHRLAWLYVTGSFPSQYIDHKNRDRADNRLENLREATPTQNQGNRKRSSSNRSGFKGVYFHKQAKARPWHAEIHYAGKKRSLGYHATPQEAHAAYVRAAVELHGEFARAS